MRRALTLAIGSVVALLLASPARAQVYVGRDTPHTGSMEVSGGVVWTQGYDLGSATAQLTRNPGTGTGSYDLFTAGTSLEAAPGVQGRFAVYLTRSLAVEAGVQYSRPKLASLLSGDAEQADTITADETITRYVFEGSAIFQFGSGRAVPFVIGGGGYIRELHDGYGVVETGNEFHAGAGLKYWFTTGRQRLGLRAEGGVSLRSGGVDFEDKRRALPTAAVSLSYLF